MILKLLNSGMLQRWRAKFLPDSEIDSISESVGKPLKFTITELCVSVDVLSLVSDKYIQDQLDQCKGFLE